MNPYTDYCAKEGVGGCFSPPAVIDVLDLKPIGARSFAFRGQLHGLDIARSHVVRCVVEFACYSADVVLRFAAWVFGLPVTFGVFAAVGFTALFFLLNHHANCLRWALASLLLAFLSFCAVYVVQLLRGGIRRFLERYQLSVTGA